jgi:hypothetical protein
MMPTKSYAACGQTDSFAEFVIAKIILLEFRGKLLTRVEVNM